MSYCIKYIILMLVLTGCVSNAKYGIQDSPAQKKILRINKLSTLRAETKYHQLEKELIKDVENFADDSYARPRLYNELASLYSYQLLDIERAIEIDTAILSIPISVTDLEGNFIPKYNVANEVILGDLSYVSDFIEIKKEDIILKAKDRLLKNKRLVKGKTSKSKKYREIMVREHVFSVNEDINNGFSSPADKKILISRLIKGEYELKKIDSKYKYQAGKYFKDGSITLEEIDLSEIDFISLSDYLDKLYVQTHEVQFLEYALNTIYKPYINIRKPRNRWNYNVLINRYISKLIKSSYETHNYQEMLYYISLNKSRMLLEERLIQSKSNILFKSNNELKRNVYGLPDKREFLAGLRGIDNFLDFYVDGFYSKEHKLTTKIARSVMPFSTRDFGIESTEAQEEVFVDSSVYMTYVTEGKVDKVEKISGNKLRRLKHQLNSSLNLISQRNFTGNYSGYLNNLSKKFKLPQYVTISPDKWLSRHPLNFHLNTKSVRSINLFTTGEVSRLKTLDVVGFFNPTMDLDGAEQEADAILSSIPSAKVFKRESAKLSKLGQLEAANIVHFSMHGGFNSDAPQYSKLYFSGSERGLNKNDPNALYAKDMGNYEILQNRDLIFAAACETGKISADQSNESELIGILRPLTANRNKNIILSLWKVDDQATKDFVAWFYQDLNKSHIVSEAFLSAQLKVQNKYKDPYYWAAFYLSQAN